MIDPESASRSIGLEPSVHETAIVKDTRLGEYCEVCARTTLIGCVLGDHTYINTDSQASHTTFGKFCSIASNVRLNPGNHALDRVMLNRLTYRSSLVGYPNDDMEFFEGRRSRTVTLGHDVWIGHGAILLPGVDVGSGAAIGAGAVVTKDVPPFTIAVGNPARHLRLRFQSEVVKELLRIAWWDWPLERLIDAMEDFRHLDAQSFCVRYA